MRRGPILRPLARIPPHGYNPPQRNNLSLPQASPFYLRPENRMSIRAATWHERFTLAGEERSENLAAFAADVRAGLAATPKRLSCRFIYDKVGSELFERICQLPEYYPTGAEREILTRHADRIVGLMPHGVHLAELGSGSSDKTQVLIAALLRAHPRLLYVPMDISRAALESAAEQLLDRFEGLRIRAYMGEYHDGLAFVQQFVEGPKCLSWLGSSIGNLARPAAAAFLQSAGACLAEHDRMLIGIDLRKDGSVLEQAYDDPAGVTASFNANILGRINREFGGDFDLEAFRYEARYDEHRGVVEMFQISRRAQAVRIEKLDLDVSLAADEEIHTESSYKYSLAEIDVLAADAGLGVVEQWFDQAKRFTLVLLEPQAE